VGARAGLASAAYGQRAREALRAAPRERLLGRRVQKLLQQAAHVRKAGRARQAAPPVACSRVLALPCLRVGAVTSSISLNTGAKCCTLAKPGRLLGSLSCDGAAILICRRGGT